MAGRRSTRRPTDPWDVAVRVATARVACSTCGPIIVPFDDVELVAAHDAIWYQFTCRTCGGANTVTTAPYATDLLVLSGIRIRLVLTPSEVEERRASEPWTSEEIDALLDAIDAIDAVGPSDPDPEDHEATPDGGGSEPRP